MSGAQKRTATFKRAGIVKLTIIALIWPIWGETALVAMAAYLIFEGVQASRHP